MMNQTIKVMQLVSILLVMTFSYSCSSQARTLSENGGAGDATVITIRPSKTDIKIENANEPHFIKYKASNTENKLLLFLGDTDEIPEKGPMDFFDVAIEEGYKVVNLSYKTMESVTRVCRSIKLSDDSHCTEKLRTKRIYGTPTTNLIEDEPQDAIVNRLVKLLTYLNTNDAAGNWGVYLSGDQPNWELITLAGQSQGGGMAEFIAKTKKVNRIISFSGGTDYSKTGKIAQWYYSSSKTPSSRWFGVYHAEEHKADVLASSFSVMEIPADHTFVLDLEVPKKKDPKFQGVRNTAYRETWKTLLKE